MARPAPACTVPAPEVTLAERVARRLSWRHAAVAALLCWGISAAMEDSRPGTPGPIAFPAQPHPVG
jgi:hypothetical protein